MGVRPQTEMSVMEWNDISHRRLFMTSSLDNVVMIFRVRNGVGDTRSGSSASDWGVA